MEKKHKVRLRRGRQNNRIIESSVIGELYIAMKLADRDIDIYYYSGESIHDNGEVIYLYDIVASKHTIN